MSDKPTIMERLDCISSAVLTVFGLGIIEESLRLPRLENLHINPYTVPGLLPGILGIAITLCSATILVRSLARGGWRLGLSREGVAHGLLSATAARMTLVLVLTLAYALLLFGSIDFRIATTLFVFLFVVATEWMAGERLTVRRIAIALVLALVIAFAVDALFEKVFYVRLPG